MSTDSTKSLTGSPAPRLLVVDDDLVQRSIIARIGVQAGYDTSLAATVDDAAVQIAECGFDCVTLDLSLGDQSGTRLLDLIATSGTRSVIVISGCDNRLLNSATQLVRTVGMSAHQVPKPLDISELRRLLVVCMEETPAVRRRPAGAAIDRDSVASAIERGEIIPWLQPKVDLLSGRVVGCEALARWPHKTLGMIPPDNFIPLVEASGLMPALTRLLLGSSTLAVREIVEMDPNFTVAVNISASLLCENAIFDYVDQALSASGLSAGSLVLEVTESVAMSNVAQATDILVGLRIKGLGLSIDDFGTGYSSLAALARMPFNELKIDGQFVRESEANPDMARVVRACVKLGQEMDMKVVAEGIETPHMLARLRAIGCDIGQGMVFLPAVEPARLADYARRFSGSDVGLPFKSAELDRQKFARM